MCSYHHCATFGDPLIEVASGHIPILLWEKGTILTVLGGLYCPGVSG